MTAPRQTSEIGHATVRAWLAEELCSFRAREGGDSYKWLVGDAVEGTQVFGGTGSGKTSGSGKAIATAFLRKGFGGLVLTAKPDDLQTWIDYATSAFAPPVPLDQMDAIALEALYAKICDTFIVLTPEGSPHKASVIPRFPKRHPRAGQPIPLPTCRGFNFLKYEQEQGSGLTFSIVALFLSALSPGTSSVSADPYWDEALRELLTHAVDLARFAKLGNPKLPGITLENLYKIVQSAPQSREQVRQSEWQRDSVCWKSLEGANAAFQATHAGLTDYERADLEGTLQYWLHDFPAITDRTRSVIVSSFTAKASGLMRYPLKQLLCSEHDQATSGEPDVTFGGKVLVLNLPVKVYGEVGSFAQILYKTVWQHAVQRRVSDFDGTKPIRPVFLWADESQFFISKEDPLFQTTARSALAATVYLSQNISNYYSAMGGRDARAATDSLLGNLQTKIFHANGDPATLEWAERMLGKSMQRVTGTSSAEGKSSQSSQKSLMPVLSADDLLSLRTGGERHERIVDAIIVRAGKRAWGDEEARFFKAWFAQ